MGRIHYANSNCGGLNENDPHQLIYLNACSPVSGTAWEGLGGVVLLEKVCHREWALSFQKPMPGTLSPSL